MERLDEAGWRDRRKQGWRGWKGWRRQSVEGFTHLPVLWGGVLVHGLDGGDERAVRVLQHRAVEGLQQRRVVVHVHNGDQDLLLQAGVALVLRQRRG